MLAHAAGRQASSQHADDASRAHRRSEPLISDRARKPPLTQHRDGLDSHQIGGRDVTGATELGPGPAPVVLVIPTFGAPGNWPARRPPAL